MEFNSFLNFILNLFISLYQISGQIFHYLMTPVAELIQEIDFSVNLIVVQVRPLEIFYTIPIINQAINQPLIIFAFEIFIFVRVIQWLLSIIPFL